MKYLIGLDIGTSSVKGVLMTRDGKVTAKAHEDFAYNNDKNGVVEILAENFLRCCFKAIKGLSDSVKDGEVYGICASSASGNLVVLDKDLKPSTAIINWQDSRVNNEAREVLGRLNDSCVYKKAGWPFDYKSFPLAQLCYIIKHSPEILDNAGMVAMSTEYLYYVLTGKWGISLSAGTPFYLIDQTKGIYNSKFLDKLGIDESILPPIKKCGEILGYVTEDISKEIGIPSGIPVVLGSFDHPSAARGAGVLSEGEMLLSCGTSWVGFFPIKSRDLIVKAKTLIDPFLSETRGCWATMISLPSISARIKTYVNRYIDDSEEAYKIFGELASKSKTGADGLNINPLDEPDDNKILKYPKEHIARAIMEGTVKLLKENLDSLKKKGISAECAIMVGGPSENPMWIKIIEEICGIPVKVVHGEVAGAVGAAVLAGIGVGIYNDEYHAQYVFNLKREGEKICIYSK